ncbi:MAG: 3-deoxy-7-phosphoheptulonate synthase [Moritella sp.]|uniref:3-deoxy-7-phosphoheptulonate synthase n=1 Tax=Moritella sp. TaxID=78556 RepID=UPI0029A665FC|nr:3-deoxy-7-phosphoheptulonate synthase [Moritella sp.]MDX2320554.1 3-deoxy-7-phosphoheptulonate synthase [Moritella sp.]
MTIKTDELRTTYIDQVITPSQLVKEFPLSDNAAQQLVNSRREIEAIIEGKDKRLLVIIGPCSIHDTSAALDYARRLKPLQEQYKDSLVIAMRVYFEKPRTIVGWKGLISDPDLNGKYQANKGLRLARKLLVDITEIGLPIATEFLDMVNGQYIADLISWGAIGARTTESQVHREMASALSCPVGFKNGTDGNTKIAIDAVRAAQVPHIFYSPDKDGLMTVYQTHGNPFGHVILRGGKTPNYDKSHIDVATQALTDAGLVPSIVVDFSHGNSQKVHTNQLNVAEDVMAQMRTGSMQISGIMAESFIEEGNQAVVAGEPLVYGKSITDACIHWQDTEKLLADLALAASDRIAIN